MASNLPDWQWFRAFLAVVREGSLSSAARVLGTTQPTMGRQIAALEASLGIKPAALVRTSPGLIV
jgi:DNA-binding transcriptional LysR family regulator